VQDLTVTPALDDCAELRKEGPKFEGTGCHKCHSSGPLTIHPAHADLVLDAPLAAAIGRHLADQPRSQFVLPEDSPKPPTGEKLTLRFCAKCHDDDGDRDALYQVHSHPIRALVDFGHMPPNRHLKPKKSPNPRRGCRGSPEGRGEVASAGGRRILLRWRQSGRCRSGAAKSGHLGNASGSGRPALGTAPA
jgi:hypothetical protein